MNQKEINLDKVFNMFKSDDVMRPPLCQPFEQSGLYVSTDAHAMIFMPVENVALGYPHQDMPNAYEIIPKQSNCNETIIISELSKSLVPDIIDEVIFESKLDTCTACGGDGEVEYEFEHGHETFEMDGECPICEGKGKEEIETEKPTGKKIPDDNKFFQLLNSVFSYKQIKRLIDACEIMEVNSIVKTYGEPLKLSLFNCGEFSIAIMPIMIDERANDTITLIK